MGLKVYEPLQGHSDVPLLFANGKRFKYPNEPFVAPEAIENLIKAHGADTCWKIGESAVGDDIRGIDVSGKTVLFVREGGLGDILWISRCIYELKRQRGEFHAIVSTDTHNQMVFSGTNVAKTVDYPVPLKTFEAADYRLVFAGLVESDTTGRSVYDIYREHLGMASFERRPYYVLPPRQKELAKSWLRKKTKRIKNQPRVMIHMGASTPWKSWHPRDCIMLADELAKEGITVFLVGSKINWRWQPTNRFRNIFQLCSRPGPSGENTNYWTIDRTVGLLSQMDVFVGPDSGFVHMADALDIPSIAIYGPFPSIAYVQDYPRCRAVEPERTACFHLPCFPHLHRVCKYMDVAGYSKCLATIKPDMIKRMVLEELE